jgi:hypothetical protein
MAKNLRKFVNPSFTRTVPLEPMRRLLERHRDQLTGFDFGVFNGEPPQAREAIAEFFEGPESSYPEGLVADLHRIADLGNEAGLVTLLERARRDNVVLVDGARARPEQQAPKHVALVAFLDHPKVFDAASDMLAFRYTSFAEYDGVEEGVQAQLDESTRAEFEAAAKSIFEEDLRGCYCRVGWYDDDDDVHLVVTYGKPYATTPVIDGGVLDVVCYRAAAHAALCYSAADGRLKIHGVPKARRTVLAEIFARCILGHPGFFTAPHAQKLYSLAVIERDWPEFRFTHAFDPSIRRVEIVEAQVDRVSQDLFGNFDHVEWSLVARDRCEGAVARLQAACPALEFQSGAWRLSHIVMRLSIEVGAQKLAKVIVKVKPTAQAIFKRERFEKQVMDLLRRNGFCCERDANRAALAAE